MIMKYIEIGEIKIDKQYAESINKVLKANGYETALIYNGMTEQRIRILRVQE